MVLVDICNFQKREIIFFCIPGALIGENTSHKVKVLEEMGGRNRR